MPPRKPPPEAALIAARREALVPHVSQREAARRAGISPTRWRQLESGFIRVKGRDYPETAPPETLAQMAAAVGVTAAELAGLADAAMDAGDRERLESAAAILTRLPAPSPGDDDAPATQRDVRELAKRLEWLAEQILGEQEPPPPAPRADGRRRRAG